MEQEALERLLAEGRSLEQIAQRFGKHPSTISYWLRKFDLRPVHRERHLARGELERELLATLVSAGLSITQIAAELGRSKATVRHWLRRHELQTKRSKSRAVNADARAGVSGPTAQMTCPTHGATTFKLRPDGSGYRCLSCRAEAVTKRRRRVKEVLIAEAGGACVLCGYDRHAGALHFHHVNPAEKSFALSERGVARSIDRARAEAQKCVLLCSNCHAEVEGGFVSIPA